MYKQLFTLSMLMAVPTQAMHRGVARMFIRQYTTRRDKPMYFIKTEYGPVFFPKNERLLEHLGEQEQPARFVAQQLLLEDQSTDKKRQKKWEIIVHNPKHKTLYYELFNKEQKINSAGLIPEESRGRYCFKEATEKLKEIAEEVDTIASYIDIDRLLRKGNRSGNGQNKFLY